MRSEIIKISFDAKVDRLAVIHLVAIRCGDGQEFLFTHNLNIGYNSFRNHNLSCSLLKTCQIQWRNHNLSCSLLKTCQIQWRAYRNNFYTVSRYAWIHGQLDEV